MIWKMNKLVLIFLIMGMFLFLPHTVKANWAGCHAMLNDSSPVNVGDTFDLDVGSEGITYQTDIYGLHYVIEYDKNVLEPVLNNGITSYYNWETITSKVQEYDYSRVSYLIVDMKTSDKSKYVNDNNNQLMFSFVKLARIRFKVKETNENSTIVSLNETALSDGYYYPTTPLMSYKNAYNNYTDQNGNPHTEESIEACVDKVRTFVNIYKKAYLSNITVNNSVVNNFNRNTYTYSIESTSKEVNIGASSANGYTVSGDIGKKVLNNGNNNFVIKVTSPTGDIKNYTLNINYENKSNKSSINTLKSLTLSAGELKFNSNENNYNVEVENDVDKITINSTLTDSKSSYVSDYGNREVELKEGINELLIKVKAENGSINTYTLIVTRKAKNNTLDVKKIVISDYSLDFSSNKTNYNLIVKNDVKKLDILVELFDKEADYSISGNENLKNGSTITIIVTNKAGDLSKKYYINIIKQAEKEDVPVKTSNSYKFLIVLCAMLFIGLVLVSIIAFKNRKA